MQLELVLHPCYLNSNSGTDLNIKIIRIQFRIAHIPEKLYIYHLSLEKSDL